MTHETRRFASLTRNSHTCSRYWTKRSKAASAILSIRSSNSANSGKNRGAPAASPSSARRTSFKWNTKPTAWEGENCWTARTRMISSKCRPSDSSSRAVEQGLHDASRSRSQPSAHRIGEQIPSAPVYGGGVLGVGRQEAAQPAARDRVFPLLQQLLERHRAAPFQDQ